MISRISARTNRRIQLHRHPRGPSNGSGCSAPQSPAVPLLSTWVLAERLAVVHSDRPPIPPTPVVRPPGAAETPPPVLAQKHIGLNGPQLRRCSSHSGHSGERPEAVSGFPQL